jgi:hypothetical protein
MLCFLPVLRLGRDGCGWEIIQIIKSMWRCDESLFVKIRPQRGRGARELAALGRGKERLGRGRYGSTGRVRVTSGKRPGAVTVTLGMLRNASGFQVCGCTGTMLDVVTCAMGGALVSSEPRSGAADRLYPLRLGPISATWSQSSWFFRRRLMSGHRAYEGWKRSA